MPKSICQTCSTEFSYRGGNAGLYCSRACYYAGRKEKNIKKLTDGKYSVSSRGEIRTLLIELRGHKCSCCYNDTWLEKPIPLELDHIDGNAGNNHPTNLQLLCPNCHAMTPTYKAKNKGNGRAARGLPTY